MQHVFAPYYHANICKVTKRIWTCLQWFTFICSLETWSIGGFISFSLPYKYFCDNKERRDTAYRNDQIFKYFCRIWFHFYYQVLVIELQSLKYVKYVHLINQMRLFWLLNIKYFSIIFLNCILFCFIYSNQNKCIWLFDCTYFTYLKNCGSITITWW